MSRRALLSAEQRDRLFAVPTDPAEMARHTCSATQTSPSSDPSGAV